MIFKGERATIGAGAFVGAGASLSKSPLYIIGTKHLFCQYSATEVKIGCTVHPIQYWLDNYESIGMAENYTPKEIEEYHKYIVLASELMKEV